MSSNIIALDIGKKRIGVARADKIARLPQPLATLANDDSFGLKLKDLLIETPADELVVGLPRSLDGNETEQTTYTKEFVAKNLKDYKIVWQDETLSTVKAQGYKAGPHGIDADAACVILEDYLELNNEI